MKESNQVIYKIIYYISQGCVLFIAWFLFWQSLLMTARIDFEVSEHTYYVHGKAIWVFLGICIMIFFFSKLNMLREKKNDKISKIIGGVFANSPTICYYGTECAPRRCICGNANCIADYTWRYECL